MTPAEFKTIRESLGLSQSDLSDMTGKTIRTIQNWESDQRPKGVPLEVGESLQDLDRIIRGQSSQKRKGFFGNQKPSMKVFIRYRTDDEFFSYESEAFQAYKTVDLHSVYIRRSVENRKRAGNYSRIVFMNPENFQLWCTTPEAEEFIKNRLEHDKREGLTELQIEIGYEKEIEWDLMNHWALLQVGGYVEGTIYEMSGRRGFGGAWETNAFLSRLGKSDRYLKTIESGSEIVIKKSALSFKRQ